MKYSSKFQVVVSTQLGRSSVGSRLAAELCFRYLLILFHHIIIVRLVHSVHSPYTLFCYRFDALLDIDQQHWSALPAIC